MSLWAYQRGITLDFSQPGKPTDNALIEAFCGRFPAECLNSYWLIGLQGEAEKLKAWLMDHNDGRTHSAIGHKSPTEQIKSAHDTRPCTSSKGNKT